MPPSWPLLGRGTLPPDTPSILVLLGPRVLQKDTHVLLGHSEQICACVHDGLAALGALAAGLAANASGEEMRSHSNPSSGQLGSGLSPPLMD